MTKYIVHTLEEIDAGKIDKYIWMIKYEIHDCMIAKPAMNYDYLWAFKDNFLL